MCRRFGNDAHGIRLFVYHEQALQVGKKMKITANIATMPERAAILPQMVASIYAQFDEIRIWCNGYTPFGIPEIYDPQGKVFLGGCHNNDDLADNGKFAWLEQGMTQEYYFTLDDDILYPEDYVATTLANLSKYPGHIICYHGRKLTGTGLPYYPSHQQYRFNCHLDHDTRVDVAGTGVTAFNTQNFNPYYLWASKRKRMSDLLFSLEAAQQNIPMMCCSHNAGWFGYLNPTHTILGSFLNMPTPVQDELADRIYSTLHTPSNDRQPDS